uniref:F-box domain-containing protein n=1 Tax=Parastrongyloides trichosuri TaxID=131310 RepID=A0A0N5A0P9_PARTI
MGSEEENIQSVVNKTESIHEVVEILQSRCNSKEDINKYYIDKICCNNLNYFALKISDHHNVSSAEILCSFEKIKNIPLEYIEHQIMFDSKINREHSLFVGFRIDDDTKGWREDDVSILAERYAEVAKFLYKVFPNACRLGMSMNKELPPENGFLLYIIDKLNIDNIEEIGLINLCDILTYTQNHSLLQKNIFSQLLGLKKFTIEIPTKIHTNIISNISNNIKNFLKCLSEIKNITLELYVKDVPLSMNVAVKILKISEKINLKTSLFLDTNWNIIFTSPRTKLISDSYLLINHLTMTNITITQIDEFNLIYMILTYARELKYLSICFSNRILIQLLYQFSTINECLRTLKNNFNFLSTLKKLQKVILYDINFNEVTPDVLIRSGFNTLHEALMESLISILPTSVTTLNLYSIHTLNITFFDKISATLPYFQTIHFNKILNVPHHALYRVPTLKNVIIHGEIPLHIPTWIDVVVFCYHDEILNNDIYKLIPIDTSFEHYYNLMNTSSFKQSFKKIVNSHIYYIAFLKTITQWINVFYFMEDCI